MKPIPGTSDFAGPACRARWAEIADDDPNALVSQTPLWMTVLERSGRFRDASRWYRFADGVEAVLILARRRYPGVLGPPASLPHGWGIGGAVSTAPLTGRHTSAIFKDLIAWRQLRVLMWPSPMQGDAWERGRPEGVVVQPRRAHVLRFEGDFEHVYRKQFASGTRRYYTKSLENGIEIEECTDGRFVPELYELIMRAVPRWAAQQNEPLWLARARTKLREPPGKFRVIAETLGPQCRIAVARIDGVAVGAALFLVGRNAEAIWFAIDPERGLPLHAATALQVHKIRTACESGCGYIDLGETGRSKGLADGKTRYGAVGIDYASYRIERFPFTAAEEWAKGAVKRIIGFRDVQSEAADWPGAKPDTPPQIPARSAGRATFRSFPALAYFPVGRPRPVTQACRRPRSRTVQFIVMPAKACAVMLARLWGDFVQWL